MPATDTLPSTTLKTSTGAGDRAVQLTGVTYAPNGARAPIGGIRLFCEGEMMDAVSLGIDNWVNVRRGVDGTTAAPHSSGATVYLARPDQFYTSDPVGAPPPAVPVSPWINVINGNIWFAQGDTSPEGKTRRWWQKETMTAGVGPLGIRTMVTDPSSST